MIPLPHPVICAVTPGWGATGPAFDRMAAAIAAGIDLLQVREPQLTGRDLHALAVRLADLARGTRTMIVVNERADVAIAAGAGGVHLRGDSVPASRLRPIVPSGFLIGRSVHSAGEAQAAERDGACDYLLFGTVFASASKPAGHPVAGPEALAAVTSAVTIPVLAIGGITLDRLPEVARAGAAGVAAIALFAEPSRVAAMVRAAREVFDT